MRTVQTPHRKATPKRAGDVMAGFVRKLLDCERNIIACGWVNPGELLRLADVHGLAGDSFDDECCGWVLAYLLGCTEAGLSPDVDECLQMAEQHPDVPLDTFDRSKLVALLDGGDPDRLTFYVDAWLRLHRHRERGHKWLRVFADTIDGIVIDLPNDQPATPIVRPTRPPEGRRARHVRVAV